MGRSSQLSLWAYQTGFDEPLLHTMYVDKKLQGVKALDRQERSDQLLKVFTEDAQFAPRR